MQEHKTFQIWMYVAKGKLLCLICEYSGDSGNYLLLLTVGSD